MLCSVLRAFKVFFVGNALFSSRAIVYLDSKHSTVAITYHLKHNALHLDHTVTLVQNQSYQECFKDHPHTVTNQYLYLSSTLKDKLKHIEQITEQEPCPSTTPCPMCPSCPLCPLCPLSISHPSPIINTLQEKSSFTVEQETSTNSIRIVTDSKNHDQNDKNPTIRPTQSVSHITGPSIVKKNEILSSNHTVLPSSTPIVSKPIPTTSNTSHITHTTHTSNVTHVTNTSTIQSKSDSFVVTETQSSDKKTDRRPSSTAIRPTYLIREPHAHSLSPSQRIYTNTRHMFHGWDASPRHSDRVSNVNDIKLNHSEDESDSDSDSDS